MTTQATRLLDAQTVLVGWINHSATDCYEHIRSSGDVVNLGTDLDATSAFVLVASHPGHSEAVTVTLELAPLLKRKYFFKPNVILNVNDSEFGSATRQIRILLYLTNAGRTRPSSRGRPSSTTQPSSTTVIGARIVPTARLRSIYRS